MSLFVLASIGFSMGSEENKVSTSLIIHVGAPDGVGGNYHRYHVARCPPGTCLEHWVNLLN